MIHHWKDKKSKDLTGYFLLTCGTINISKYVHSFLSTNPSTLNLSSLVSEF